jgi:hypothetical protein
MYGLTIELERCADGVELVELDELEMPADAYARETEPDEPSARPEMVFRYRTERRETYLKTIENLESPIVVTFVNATDDRKRQLFFKQFGLGTPVDHTIWNRPYRARLVLARALKRSDTLEHQSKYRELLHIIGGEDRIAAMTAINSTIGNRVGAENNLIPTFHLAGPHGTPQLLLKSASLLGFMKMEMAMIASNGARVGECEKCSAMFVTGPMTGRRSSAIYCSDRCRVAAMRARQATAT